jgi:hypothetical protein
LPVADVCAFLRTFSDSLTAIYNLTGWREAGISFREINLFRLNLVHADEVVRRRKCAWEKSS